MIRRRALIAAATACATSAHGQADAITVRVEGAMPTVMPVVAKILERRFASLESSLFDSTSANVSGDRVTLRFAGWSPSDAQIDYLTSTAGTFRVSFQGERETPLITEDDIADSRLIVGQGQPGLAIRLTDAGAARVALRTRDAVGKEVFVEWQGRPLARLRISGPLARDIALSVGLQDDVRLISAVLRGGRLPPGVRLARTR
jgi:hypothetical protein